MCGNCGHPGPQHSVMLAPGVPLPKVGEWAPICVGECVRCREEVREQQRGPVPRR
jgi:hypothetical protein